MYACGCDVISIVHNIIINKLFISIQRSRVFYRFVVSSHVSDAQVDVCANAASGLIANVSASVPLTSLFASGIYQSEDSSNCSLQPTYWIILHRLAKKLQLLTKARAYLEALHGWHYKTSIDAFLVRSSGIFRWMKAHHTLRRPLPWTTRGLPLCVEVELRVVPTLRTALSVIETEPKLLSPV